MYEDDPQDKVFDLLGEATFGDHPLGRAVIGRARRSIGRRRRRRCAPSTPRATCPGDVVVAAAGSVDHDALVALVERAGRRARRRPRARAAAAAARRPPRRAGASSTRPTEQYHVCLGAPGIARDDERRYALRVLDNDPRRHVVLAALPGGAREARRWPTASYSFHAQYAGAGPGRAVPRHAPGQRRRRALRVVGDELERFRARARSPPTSSAAPRRTSRAASCSTLESTTARMNRLGVVGARRPAAPERRRADRAHRRRDRSTTSSRWPGELLAPERLSAAGIGADEAAFRAALEPCAGTGRPA